MAEQVVVEYIKGAGVHLLRGRRPRSEFEEVQSRIFRRGEPVAVDPQEAADLCATGDFRIVKSSEECEAR